jgi:hypothetical protein
VHRLGQTKPVTVVRLLCRDTVEDVIMQRAAYKLRLSQVGESHTYTHIHTHTLAQVGAYR